MTRAETPSSRLVVTCTYSRRPEFVRWLRERVAADRVLRPRVELLLAEDRDEARALLPQSQVHATASFSPEDYASAEKLEWLQLGMAGADSAMFPALIRSRVIVTTSVGVHDETVPQAAWAFVLAFATGLHAGYQQKHAGVWDRRAIVLTRRPLAGQRMLIVGAGRIGGLIARLARQAGMSVWGVRRRLSQPRPPHFEKMISPRGLRGALAQADFVILTVPGGRATEKMIGAAELARMKRSACLINMARGSVIDEPALIDALREGRIAGAGLDVFATEPLPPEHPFYTLPNVAMTPHTSGDTADYAFRAGELFLQNLKRYLNGRALVNVVNKRLGY